MTTATSLPAQWIDSKRHLWLLGIPVTLLPLNGGLLVQDTGSALFWWLPMFFFYVFLPLMDWIIGADSSNPPDDAVPELSRDQYYRWAVYLSVPLQYVTFVYGVWVVATHDLAWYSWLGLMLGVGMVGGIGINSSHELAHKTDPFERWLAKIALAQTDYGQFFVQHTRGHHVRVATAEDPVPARFGDGFWEF